uniref:Alpha-mannosidase n=2 Tax=Echinococcus granulosus TaxID=6210 RepID=A0A068WT80_ECHGR|nr:lysosomal alpha mannosidase [Echinococcus granulosus]
MLLCGVFSLILLLRVTLAEECGYDLCPPTKEDHINVHIIPHTHDDVGWLKNIDQYYFGDVKWYQTAAVQYILDSVMHALSLNPSRKFTYVEMAFFERWWRLQNAAMQELVHRLVRNGQLEFALGGWSMNDEAVVHYSDSVDQLTRGLAFLNATFGDCGRPRVAWQIDPFGHARQQARIFMDAGFDGVFFQRMDYREKRRRLKDREMEVLWKADPTDNTTGLFTHMLYQSYCSPPGFCFDSKCDDPPMIVDPFATNYNVPSRVRQFLEYVGMVAKSYATNHIFVPMGCDFTYENANENFINLDRLIEHVNAHQSHEAMRPTPWTSSTPPMHLLYSSPACYTKSVNEAFRKRGMMPQREGDFFPYASASNTFWTGFYTSRPTQKFMVRQASSLLAACEQAHLMKPSLGSRYKYPSRLPYDYQKGTYLDSNQVVDQLRQMMGVMQHHDAITGTEKQHVSNDYRQRLTDAMRGCQQLVSSVADSLLERRSHSGGNGFKVCEYLNVSVCLPLTRKNGLPDALVAVYNPHGWDDLQPWLRLPLHPTKGEADELYAYTLTEYFTGETVPFQVVDLPTAVLQLPERRMLSNRGHSELVFKPSVGLTRAGFTWFALKGEESHGYGYGYQRQRRQQRISLKIGQDNLPVFQTQEGQTVTMRLMKYDASTYYKPTSGAYVFRPLKGAVPIGNATSEIIDGELVTEVRTTFTSWASLTTRLYADDRMEVEWVVGPLPNIGRRVTEVILRYRVSGDGVRPATEGEFYTDSMGNDLIKRERRRPAEGKVDSFEPPDGNGYGLRYWWIRESRDPLQAHLIEGSYYPVVNRILLKGTDYAFGVYTDRAEGGSSLAEGEVELMLHRATIVDDGLGVGEPLTERAFGEGIVVRGVHRLLLDTVARVEKMDPRLAQEVSRPPILFFRDRGNDSLQSTPTATPSLLTRSLPEGLHLLTAQQWPVEGEPSPNQLLVRLHHIGLPGTGPITMELSEAFTVGRVVKATEMSLTANQLADVARRNSLKWPSEYERRSGGDYSGAGNATRVVIQSEEVKTFILYMV